MPGFSACPLGDVLKCRGGARTNAPCPGVWCPSSLGLIAPGCGIYLLCENNTASAVWRNEPSSRAVVRISSLRCQERTNPAKRSLAELRCRGSPAGCCVGRTCLGRGDGRGTGLRPPRGSRASPNGVMRRCVPLAAALEGCLGLGKGGKWLLLLPRGRTVS